MTYQDIRGLIKTGDMIEWRSYSLLGKVIRFFSKQQVNHTSLCVNMTAMEPHKFILEANPAGVEMTRLSQRIEEFDGEVYWSALLPKYDYLREDIFKWTMLQLGKPYDYKSLFKNIFSRVSGDAKAFFCSELYFMALKSAKIVTGDKSPRPGEFGQFKVHAPTYRIK